MPEPQPMDPTEAFAQLGSIKLGETDIHGVLDRIARIAKHAIPGAAEVSVTLIRAGHPHTAAFTGWLAQDLDERQYQTGYGPCLDAAASAGVLFVPDVAAESRWPEWAARATLVGCCSLLSIGLTVQEEVSGALNVYATEPEAFDDESVTLAQTFAGYAAVALANAHLYDTTAALARQMQAAMVSRAVIEQAKGIIMGERRCSAEQAFAILAAISQGTNHKLRDVAAELVAQATRVPKR